METIYIGIDVSKLTLDVSPGGQGHQVYQNRPEGFAHLLAQLPPGAHCVLEASGPYYLPLACLLHQQGVAVSVVNPLVIKRFAQMRLLRAKTDKADARMIAAYGQSQHPPLWSPPPLYLSQLQQLQTLLESYLKQRTALRNQREAFCGSGVPNPGLSESLERTLAHLKEEIGQIEGQIDQLAGQEQAQLLGNLQSIPGLGKKTALALLVVSGGFTRFASARQLCAYVGLAPRIFQSGTSVRGKSRICKLGMGYVRRLLYLCSWSAVKTNLPCQQLYERLLERGKPKMLALIAVANKLLRQAFAIAKHQTKFDKNFKPAACF